MAPKARDHGKDIDALNRRVNVLEQGGTLPQLAPQPPEQPAEDFGALADIERRLSALEGQGRRINELHAELSRLSQGVDKVAALEAEVASLKARA